MNPGPWGILIVVVAVLLLFGRGKISGMMGEVASGIRAFQKGMKDEDEKPVQEIEGQQSDSEKETASSSTSTSSKERKDA